MTNRQSSYWREHASHCARAGVLAFISISTFCATTLAQAASTRAVAPNEAAARSTWLVEFESRPFDLQDLRAAIRSDAPDAVATVDRIVADLARKAAASQAAFVEELEALGGHCREHFWLVNACAIELPAESVDAVRDLPGVRRVIEDRPRAPSFIKVSTNAKNHAVDGLYGQGVRGKGVSVAILDSGLDITDAGRARPHRTFYVGGDPTNMTGGGLMGSRILAMRQVGQLSPDDLIGHGTPVAAVAAGEVWGTATSDRGHAPLAGIVGYSMADTGGGFAHLFTMVKAFQQTVADAKRYNIKVANMSYQGTNLSYWTEQQAIDLAAEIGDLVVTVSAGNGGASNHFAHGSTNRLAVGSVHADTRQVASFSTRGPLFFGEQYPNLVANGVNMVMPMANSENSDRNANGSSFAAPQVAGAAVLYRSVKPSANALETRAAILVASEDVAGKNRFSSYNDENSYGFGYLRDDRLVAIAQGKNGALAARGAVTRQRTTTRYSYPVVAGRDYAIAVAWNRLDVTRDERSNLDLEVRSSATNGSVVLARGTRPRVVHEFVRFHADHNEVVTVDVRAVSFAGARQTVNYDIVAAEALPFYVKPSWTSVGTSCGFSATEIPKLALSDAPEIGAAYAGLVVGSRAGVPFVLSLGFDFERFGAIQLPWSLASIGANGCSLYVSPDLFLAGGVTNALGAAQVRIVVPQDNALLHLDAGHQIVTVAPTANRLGLLTSNATRFRVGGDPR